MLRRRTRLATALALLAAAILVHPTPANAGAGLSATSGYDGSAVSIAAALITTLEVQNLNTPPDTTLTLGPIFFIPACGTTGPITSDCPPAFADPGVVSVAATAAGVAGTACEGTTFDVTQSNASTGRVELEPSTPVVLAGAGDRCEIALSVTISSVPSIDSRPGTPGIQTDGFAVTSGTSSGGLGVVASGGSFLTIEKAATEITTQVVDDEVALGEPVGDAAKLARGADPTGELAFDLYGPDDDDCSGPPAATLTTEADGAGTYASPTTVPEVEGTYRFVARYGGDDANLATSGSCNDPNETVVVTAAEPPGIRVLLDATPLSRPEPGGTFSFAASVTNTSAVPLTLTALDDDVYGDVTTRGTCTSAVSTVLGPGDTYRCEYPGDVAGNAGATQTDVLTGTAVDGAGAAVLDEDDATVSLTDVPPTATVTKTALPEERAAPGGLFTFAVAITNTSFEAATITKIVDDVHGDVARLTSSTCATTIGRTLAPQEQVTCTFPGELTGPVGTAETDVVTVTLTDDDGSIGTASDDATVRLVEPGAVPTTTSTTSPASPSSTTTPRAPTSTPTTAPRQGSPSLAQTGAALRTTAALGLGLLGSGLLLTGLGWDPPIRRRRGAPSAGRR